MVRNRPLRLAEEGPRSANVYNTAYARTMESRRARKHVLGALEEARRTLEAADGPRRGRRPDGVNEYKKTLTRHGYDVSIADCPLLHLTPDTYFSTLDRDSDDWRKGMDVLDLWRGFKGSEAFHNGAEGIDEKLLMIVASRLTRAQWAELVRRIEGHRG